MVQGDLLMMMKVRLVKRRSENEGGDWHGGEDE